MKYFIDTEFKEYSKQHKVFGINVGYPTPTIDLISIGIVAEDDRSYYTLNKDCDLKEVWNDTWLKENVLQSIYNDNINGDNRNDMPFNYQTMKWVFKNVGKSKERIAKEIVEFCASSYYYTNADTTKSWKDRGEPEFYGYYCDYDWVVFCQLFGRMLDLPKGFPMYCIDLKQMLDDKAYWLPLTNRELTNKIVKVGSVETERLEALKSMSNYPIQTNEHNAFDDAKWNLKLYKFIQEL